MSKLFICILLLAFSAPAFSQMQFTCYPTGANETPPNPSQGWGVGRFILSADQDTLYYSLFWKLQNPYSAAHIHIGAPGVPGGVVHNLASANASGSHGAWAIPPASVGDLLAGILYVNVHSNPGFPNGEIRAQILPNPIQDNTYTSVLSGANENPPNTTTSWGIGTYVLSPDQDSLYYAILWKLQNTYSASHFHVGPAGVNGPIELNFGANANATGTHGVWALSALNLSRLNNDSIYVNAHTNPGFPGGEIRDQIHYNPPVPNMVISDLNFNFPACYVGQSIQDMFQITNTGSGHLTGMWESLDRLQPVFDITPGTISVGPGQTVDYTVTFEPTFDHDFIGYIKVLTNDPDPAPTLSLSGTGCHIPVELVPLSLHSVAPTSLYFSLPWDLNDFSLLYAVEFSTDNFATSLFADEYGYGIDFVQWSSAGMWGTEGSGAILNLLPETPYQIRMRALDCTGFELIGPATEFTTPAPIPHVDDAELTIYASDADQNDVVLRYNTVTVNADGDTLPNLGFEIYHKLDYSDAFDYVADDGDGEYTYDTNGENIGFFRVIPIIQDFEQPRPFICWPPNGATVSGKNQILLCDALHLDLWTGFDIFVDFNFVGSESNSLYTERPMPGIFVDYDNFTPGFHVISCTVQVGQTFVPLDPCTINVVSNRPYVSFDAEYDPFTETFYCDTINGTNIDGSVSGIWWQNTQDQEGYNSHFNFAWDGGDSVFLVKPFPIWDTKVLTENSPTDYLIPSEYMALTFDGFKWPVIQISCCCVDIDLNTGGQAEGTYKGQKNRNLGPFVKCENDFNSVSYAFEVDITWRYFIVEEGGTMCTYGQDCKRTDTRTIGKCVDGAFVPRDPPLVDTKHKQEGGVDYPYSGESFGNDQYGSRPGDTGVDNSELGHSRWYDRPVAKGGLPEVPSTGEKFAVRRQRDAQFLVRADPPCGDPCCMTFELHWDVTFCQDCSIIHTQDPEITNIMSPAECPALAD